MPTAKTMMKLIAYRLPNQQFFPLPIKLRVSTLINEQVVVGHLSNVVYKTLKRRLLQRSRLIISYVRLFCINLFFDSAADQFAKIRLVEGVDQIFTFCIILLDFVSSIYLCWFVSNQIGSVMKKQINVLINRPVKCIHCGFASQAERDGNCDICCNLTFFVCDDSV